jgi:hypothetical protein
MYRAMPLLLGMLMTGVIRNEQTQVLTQVPLFDDGLSGYDCSDAAYWE